MRKTFIIIFFLSMLSLSCGMSTIAPSDAQLQAAQTQIDNAPIGTPAHTQAVANYQAMKEARLAADAGVSTASTVINTVVPGLGALLGLGYGIWQRSRGDKTKTALTATMAGIEDFRKIGGDEAVDKLVEMLSTAQDRAGVRTAIRTALAELKAPDVKP